MSSNVAFLSYILSLSASPPRFSQDPFPNPGKFDRSTNQRNTNYTPTLDNAIALPLFPRRSLRQNNMVNLTLVDLQIGSEASRMGRFEKGSLVVVGIILLVTGFLLRSGLIAWLLDIMGLLLIIVGIIVIVIGLVSLITSRRARGF